jgi:hypothetical protein
MDQRKPVAARAKPYGLNVVPDSGLFEYTDQRNEAETEARWRPVLEQLGIMILGIRDVPSQLGRITVDGVEWELERMGDREYRIPQSVYHCIRSAEAAGIHFAYWIWGEEQFTRPRFVPIQEEARPVPRTRKEIDPIVIGVIPTAPNRGIWCLLGKWFH